MDQYILRGKIKGHFKTKKGLILALLTLLLLGLGISVVLVQQPQILKKFAQTSETGTGTCRWQVSSNLGSYHYVINDDTTGQVLLQGETRQSSVNFEIIFGHTYSCVVFGVNECGVGPQGKDTDTCRLDVTPTATPLPTATPTTTPTLVFTPTPTLPPGVTPTETPVPTATPTLAPGITPTVTPTETPVPTATPMPTATLQPTSTPMPTVTPTPLAEELPESGFFESTYLLFASGIISILGGMLLLRIF